MKINKSILDSIRTTLVAIEEIDRAIDYYSEDKPGPAYITAKMFTQSSDFQLDRDVMLVALNEQKRRYIEYLKDRYDAEYDPTLNFAGRPKS